MVKRSTSLDSTIIEFSVRPPGFSNRGQVSHQSVRLSICPSSLGAREIGATFVGQDESKENHERSFFIDGWAMSIYQQ